MANAPTSTSRIGFIAETTFGTTPSTPTFQLFRKTQGELRLQKVVGRSDEIIGDRMIRDVQQLGQDVAGSLNFEYSDATLETFLEAATGGAWATDVLKVGNALKSFTFEERYEVGSSSYTYHRYTGCVIDSISMELTARQPIRGAIAVMGQTAADPDTAIITGATYTSANTEPIYTPNTVASISAFGLGTVPPIKKISLNIQNNMRKREVLGSLYVDSFGQGQCTVTGSMEAYFPSAALLQAVLDHDQAALTFTIGATSGKKLTVSIPKAQLTNGGTVAGGKDDDIMVNLEFEGVYDSSSGSNIVITRNV